MTNLSKFSIAMGISGLVIATRPNAAATTALLWGLGLIAKLIDCAITDWKAGAKQ